jgi:glucose/arabinose dehydrogenase
MRTRLILLFLIVCPAAAAAQHYGPTPVSLPETTFDGRLRVPRGFTVTEYAKVPGARALAVGPDGAVYVSLPRRGEIVRLVDADRNGVAESQEVAVAGLNRPHGMTFRNGWLYVANTDGVVRVRSGASGGEAEPERLNEYSGGGGHWTRTVAFGPDGAMYVSIGSSCNICVERNQDRAAVMRYDESGANGRLYARGLRNAVGMAVHPTTGEIWVTQHERDNLRPDHQDLPPEEINILRDGGDYGWPYCHSDRVPNPEFDDPARCAATLPPALPMQAHSAPLGITFLDRATRFPAEYRGDALVAFHGSWNRDEPTGAKVVRIRIRDGKPVSYEDFIVGWQDASGRRWGRPVDLVVLGDGSVVISDDQSGTIYRIQSAR